MAALEPTAMKWPRNAARACLRGAGTSLVELSVIAGLLLSLSCNPLAIERVDEGNKSGTSNAAATGTPTADDYQQVAEEFGNALVAGEYGAAYRLTSARLQRRMSSEQFTHACLDAVKQFGEAERLGPIVAERTEGLAGEAASRQYGFPEEIPDGDRLAWVHAALAHRAGRRRNHPLLRLLDAVGNRQRQRPRGPF